MNNSQEKFIGQYQIVKQIGRGQNGLVFQVKPPSTDRIVALKLYPSALLRDGFLEQFSHDLAHIKSLTHPHIVRIYTYGQTDKFPSIAMRYADGGNLESRIQAGITALSELEEPVHQICQALDYAHEQGVIHGNLKPSNILFDQDGKAYVSDFGIEAIMQNRPIESPYLAPEQVNYITADERSDVYALGMILFEWITGKTPLWTDSFLSKNGQKTLPSIRIYRPEASPMLDGVIQQATSQNPAIRFGSIKEFFRVFIKALRDTTRMSEPVRPHPLNVTDFSDSTKYDFSTIQEKSQKKETPKWITSVLTVIATAVIVFVVNTARSGDDNPNNQLAYQPAVIPDGYVLYSGKDVEMAVPSWWEDINTPEHLNMISENVELFEGQVSPEMYEILVGVRSRNESGRLQIFAEDSNSGTSMNIEVTSETYSSPQELVKTLPHEFEQYGIPVIQASVIQLPVGEAVYIQSSYSIAGVYLTIHSYGIQKNGKMYIITFSETYPSDLELFAVMIESFRIKS
jgi:serine/threonine-protein kinase